MKYNFVASLMKLAPTLTFFHYIMKFSKFISVCLQFIYVICLAIIIFIFIIINHIISLTQKKLCFEHLCQKFSLRVLLSFCLAFGQFQPGIACKTVAYKKGCNQKARNNKEKIAYSEPWNNQKFDDI